MTTATLITAKGTIYTAQVDYRPAGSVHAKREAFSALSDVVRAAMTAKAAKQGKTLSVCVVEAASNGDMIVTDAAGVEHNARLVAKFSAVKTYRIDPNAVVTEAQQQMLEKLGNGRVPANMPRTMASAIISDALAN
jgi:hypothetical protein